MYESPIEMFITELHTAYEDGIMKAVQNVGFNVNKEELIKALQYDRDQYRKGYEDGRPPNGVWELKWNTFFKKELPTCSVCNSAVPYVSNFCPHCGAYMRPREVEE